MGVRATVDVGTASYPLSIGAKNCSAPLTHVHAIEQIDVREFHWKSIGANLGISGGAPDATSASGNISMAAERSVQTLQPGTILPDIVLTAPSRSQCFQVLLRRHHRKGVHRAFYQGDGDKLHFEAPLGKIGLLDFRTAEGDKAGRGKLLPFPLDLFINDDDAADRLRPGSMVTVSFTLTGWMGRLPRGPRSRRPWGCFNALRCCCFRRTWVGIRFCFGLADIVATACRLAGQTWSHLDCM